MTDAQLSRRTLLKGALALSACALLPGSARALLAGPVRSLSFENLHTGDTLTAAYWESGAYVPDALSAINRVLRDHRNNAQTQIDTALLDQLAVLHATLGSSARIQVISGYRSPESNARMHAHSGGVASKSLHMEGRAIDIRLKDRSTLEIKKAALLQAKGGVGYYPSSDFVHIDSGRVRKWEGA